MKKFYYASEMKKLIHKMDGLFKKALGASIGAESLRYLDADGLEIYKESMDLYEESMSLLERMVDHYDEMENTLQEMEERQKRMEKMLLEMISKE